MPGLSNVPPDVKTIYLGEFTRAHAERLAAALEARDIVWWFKEPGYISRLWEHGIRMFVDQSRLEDAQVLADEVMDAGT